MFESAPDHNFTEFRRTGAAEPLGRVFDALAPELLIVASHLTRDAEGAEDLVQSTFLAAVENAQKWDPTRPLRPWLVTILVNEARMQARRARQKLPCPKERVLAHPVEAAEAHELAETIARATAALDAPYREVLALRLAHGLDPAAIAHVLGRPPETVKTQLRRGLELLRKALPKSLAPAIALAAIHERGLAAVRMEVVARAAAPKVAALAIGGLLLMKKTITVAALVLAAIGTYALWPAAPTREDPAGTSGARSVQAASAPSSQKARTEAGVAREPIDTAPLTAASHGTRARVVGRCVRAEDGQPIAGARVLWTANWDGDHFLAAFGPEPWRGDGPQITAPDGRFSVDAPVVHGLVYRLELRPTGRSPRIVTLRDLDPATPLDFGDVAHTKATSVGGTMVDDAGEPVVGVTLTVFVDERFVGLRPSGKQESCERVTAVTGAHGQFAFSGGVPVGSWGLNLEGWNGADYYRLESPTSLVIGLDAPVDDLLVRVRRDPPFTKLEVDVVDERDAAVPGMKVLFSAGESEGGWWYTTDAQGRIAFMDLGRKDDPYSLRAPPTLTHEGFARITGVRCSQRGLRVRTRTLPPLRLRVVHAEGGKPVESYAVSFLYGGQDTAVVRHVGRHEGGRLEIANAPTAGARLRVIPERDDLSAEEVDLAGLGEGARELEVRLRPALVVPVRVALRDGTGVAGVRVDLIEFRADAYVDNLDAQYFDTCCMRDERAFFRRDAALERDQAHQGGCPPLLSCGVTGADGRVLLHAAREGTSVALFAPGPGHVKALQRGIVLSRPQAEVELVVERGAELLGTVEPKEVLGMKNVRVQLERDEGTWSMAATVDASGKFAFTGLPAGEWSAKLFVHDGFGSDPVAASLPVRLVDGESREIRFDVEALRPWPVRGKVRLDGRAPAGAELRALFWPEAAPRTGPRCCADSCRLDAGGAFTMQLPAGEYVFWLEIVGKSNVCRAVVSRRHVIRSDSSELRIELESRTYRVRCVDAGTGTPLARRTVCIESRAHYRDDLTTDADGMATLRFTPGDEVWAYFEHGEKEQGPFAVPREGDVIEVALKPVNSR